MYDFCVVGGGIAGLSIAELLARSGRSVALVEKGNTLCSNASALQHSWFHAGALYAALPNNSFFRTMVGNIDDLLDFYTCFDRMNLRAERSIQTTSAQGWFTNYTIFYAFVSPWAREVNLALKLPWWLAIQRAQRRLAWFENLDFQRVLSDQVRWVERKVSVNLVKRKGSLGVNLGDLAVVLKSKDRTMDTRLIVKDLAASFLGSGGDLFLNTQVKEIRRHEVVAGEGIVRARHVVVASGDGCRHLTNVQTRVVYSPLVVVHPALSSLNFVRMTPDFSLTINHLYHKLGGTEYSVVGSALYYDDASEANRLKALEVMRKRLVGVFPDAGESQWSVYFGPKTELVNSSQLRNYQYHIIDTEDCTVALPGKFTLAFSLAVNICRHFGVEPLKNTPKMCADTPYLESIVAWPRHCLEAQQREAAAKREPAEGELQPARR